MRFGKADNNFEFMRIHTSRKIIGKADVERTVGFAGEDVDVEQQHQLRPPPARGKDGSLAMVCQLVIQINLDPADAAAWPSIAPVSPASI